MRLIRTISCILTGLIMTGAFAWTPATHGVESVKPGIPEVFSRAAPAVVKIYGASLGRQHGYGTGTLVSPDGRILTQHSVLLSSRTIRIVLHDGRRYDARVERSDDRRKLALLKIDVEGLSYLSPAASDELAVGDTVLALGNWFKIAEGQELVSLTRGIFSLKTRVDSRRLAQDYEFQGPVLLYDAITSNPGAAGGPLLDVSGRFIGLIGAIVESAQTNTRINYAIPGEELIAFLADEARPDRESSAKSDRSDQAGPRGAAGKPDLGIVISRLGYRQVSAFVERVKRDSPAAQAGIQVDDLIMAIDGRRIGSAQDYHDRLSELIPGQQVQVILKRGDQVLTVDVTVGENQ